MAHCCTTNAMLLAVRKTKPKISFYWQGAAFSARHGPLRIGVASGRPHEGRGAANSLGGSSLQAATGGEGEAVGGGGGGWLAGATHPSPAFTLAAATEDAGC
jgi:hypothetical protein